MVSEDSDSKQIRSYFGNHPLLNRLKLNTESTALQTPGQDFPITETVKKILQKQKDSKPSSFVSYQEFEEHIRSKVRSKIDEMKKKLSSEFNAADSDRVSTVEIENLPQNALRSQILHSTSESISSLQKGSVMLTPICESAIKDEETSMQRTSSFCSGKKSSTPSRRERKPRTKRSE